MSIADLCDKLIEVAFHPTPETITRLVLATFISLVIEEQVSINEKLDKIIGSYYKDGLDHLQNARYILDEERKRGSIDTARESIDAAKGKFITASNLESPLLAIKAKFFVGVCFHLLNDKELALKWYEKAYEAGQGLESKLQKKAKFSTIDYVIILIPMLTVYGIPLDILYLAYRIYTCRKARRELADLQKELLEPLSNLLAHKSKLSPPLPFPQLTVTIAPPFQPAAPRPTTWGYLIFDTGKQNPLSGSRVLVGRADLGNPKLEVDLASLPESTTVSRVHATITYDGNTCTVTDLDSKNSTYINSKRLEPHQPSPIIDGDRLNFGRVSCIFKMA
jgi:hypothetical protein